jgi:hypothetical protein
MHLLTAHELFCQRTSRDALPGDCLLNVNGNQVDAWPAAAVAACDLAGCLEDAQTDADLDDGLAHFQTLLSAEIVTGEQWREEIGRVVAALMEWGDTLAAQGA